MCYRSAIISSSLALFVLAAGAAAETCGADVVFDFSPFIPDTVIGEYFNITSITGEIVNAKVDAVFISAEDEPWVMSVGIDFPTGHTGVDSDTGGWFGEGTFITSFETTDLNGYISPPAGESFSAWFLTWAGGKFTEVRGGGATVSPMDGYFETLTLTLTFADCHIGDLNGDFTVDGADLGLLLAAWGDCGGTCAADFNADGTVDGADLGLLLGAWGDSWCPPPFC